MCFFFAVVRLRFGIRSHPVPLPLAGGADECFFGSEQQHHKHGSTIVVSLVSTVTAVVPLVGNGFNIRYQVASARQMGMEWNDIS